MTRSEAAQYREHSRATVIAAVERGGRAKATVLESRRGPQLREQVVEWINPDAILYTDEWPAYNFASRYFADHSRVIHSAHIYVEGAAHTNTVEAFFGNLKTSLRGNYKKVSRRWLQGYLNEFVWRWNARLSDRPMFEQLLLRGARS